MDMVKETDGACTSVCRVCLGLAVPHNEFKLLDDKLKHMLDFLLVKMNLDVSNKPLVCKNCAEVIEKSHYFKSMCMDSEGKIRLFNTEEDTLVTLRDACKSKDRSPDICRFCLQKVEGNFVSLDVLMEANTFSDMMKEFMPPMDLSVIESRLVCFGCQENMESCFKFLHSCRDTEEKINTYRQNNGIKSGEKIMLINVVEMFFKCKKEEETRNLVQEVKEELDKEDEGVIEHLLLNLNDGTRDHTTNMYDTKDWNYSTWCATSNETELHGEDIKVETLELKINDKALKFEPEELISENEIIINECAGEPKNVAETCKRNRRVKSEAHLHQCNICPFLTKYKYGLKQHMLTHMDSNDVQMYQCDKCEYKTRHKNTLKKHSLVHKDASDVQIYQCDRCEFQTKHKHSLKTHLLTHMDSEDVQMYQCDHCEYKTKHKNGVKKHSVIHQDSSDVQMYHCDNCGFQTIHKKGLKNHLLIHKNSDDLRMYQCDNCEFQSKYKCSLKKHLLMHKNPCDIQMYQCDSCKFKTKRKDHLKTHMLIHKNSSDVPVYQCDTWHFQTRHKRCIKTQLLIDKDSCDIQMYQCDSCDYKTKCKNYLRKHMIVHKNIADVHIYQCDRCVYQTKYKAGLKRHWLSHKDPSDVDMHQCDR